MMSILFLDPYKVAEKILAMRYGYAKMVEAHYEWRPNIRYWGAAVSKDDCRACCVIEYREWPGNVRFFLALVRRHHAQVFLSGLLPHYPAGYECI